MLEELEVINYWLTSEESSFLTRHGIDSSYFFATSEIINFIEDYINQTHTTPTLDLVNANFEEFKVLSDMDSLDYLIKTLKENKLYVEYSPVLVANADMLNQNKVFEALWVMKANVDQLLKKYTTKLTQYSWVKDVKIRLEKYLESHSNPGLAGIPTGVETLDELTGGWRDDDFILISGRTGEGKSLLALFFAFTAWKTFAYAGIENPVIYITTEMPEDEIAYRLDTFKANFSNKALNEGTLQDIGIYQEYLEHLKGYKTDFLILSQESNNNKPFTPADIEGLIEYYKPGLVVVDQLYDLSDGTNERDIRRKIVNISTQIREINLNKKVPMVLVSQASREAAKEARKDKDATPELFHIQESDNPAQKATRVLTLKLNDDILKITLRKNRGGVKDRDCFIKVDIDTGYWKEVSQKESYF